jgi:hypothetical protein
VSGHEPRPTGRETARAAIVAALAAVAAAALPGLQLPLETAAGWVLLGVLFGTPIALLHAFAVGLPLYLTFRRRWRLRWWSAAVGGFLTGAVPILLLKVFTGPGFDFYMAGTTVLVEQGRYTSAGWWGLLASSVWTGLAGLLGGISFWLILRRSGSCR